MAIQKITASEGQSVLDVNLMYYSGFDNIVKFCKDNAITSLNDLDVSGKTLQFDTNLNSQKSTTSVFNARGYVFVTGVFLEDARITEEGSSRVYEDGYLRILE